MEEQRNLLNKMKAHAAKQGKVSMASGYWVKRRNVLDTVEYDERSFVCCKKYGLL
jgi:hypothetical protein